MKADLEAAAGKSLIELEQTIFFFDSSIRLAKAAAEQRLQEKRLADGLRPVNYITCNFDALHFDFD